tara:strand:+ start:878 stop:1324 length:447 start_codon:yes stop_codon:yes gene_type:complete
MLDPSVWGPHYWFVLHTIALTFPPWPTDVAKKKYYDLIQNLPLFLPQSESGGGLAAFLDRYPVTPYLDSRDSFRRWVHFLHNKINAAMGRRELGREEADAAYWEHYVPKEVVDEAARRRRRVLGAAAVFAALLIAAGGLAARGNILEL